MTKPRVFVTRVIAQEALGKIAQVTEMEVWPEEIPPSSKRARFTAGGS